jgi:citrate synthase
VLACQPESIFANKYRHGLHKSEYWEATFEDSINLIAKTKRIAALIFHNLYQSGDMPDSKPDLDFSADYAQMMGFNDPDVDDLLRLYLTVHMDHEGGNVSAHANRLVGSALSDPYLSFSASLNGLAGPLHGLANQECLRWLLQIKEKYGDSWTREQVAQHVWDTLNSGSVVPGYGHAVLRKTDPRFTLQLEFAEKHFPEDNLIQLVRAAYEVVPKELAKTGKVSNPFPNVDAASGSLLMHYGINQYDYYTVLFGVARAYGVASSLVWDRALGLPIERPGSMTLEGLIEKADTLAAEQLH